MTTPTSQISLLDIQNEFGGPSPILLSNYYAGGPYVANPPPTSNYQTAPVPLSGAISLGCFRGLSKFTQFSTIINLAGTSSDGVGSRGFVLSGMDPTWILQLDLPPGQTYTGWSPWGNDCDSAVTNVGYAWGNRFFVVKGNSVSNPNFPAFGQNSIRGTPEEARAAFAPVSITGYSSYIFYIQDTDPGNNRGGLSIRVTHVATAPPPAPALTPSGTPVDCGQFATPVDTTNGAGGASTCFPAGAMVLMGNGQQKPIETIQVGELVMGMKGPTPVLKVERPQLGPRKMLAFSDGHKWSEEHAHWTKNAEGSQYWWSANKPMWLREVQDGYITGLTKNDRMRTGDEAAAFAHVEGWKVNQILEDTSYSSDSILYVPFTSGSPIIVNGYVVGAGVDESGFNYNELNWDTVQKTL